MNCGWRWRLTGRLLRRRCWSLSILNIFVPVGLNPRIAMWWGRGYESAGECWAGGRGPFLTDVRLQPVGHFGWLTQAQMMDGLALAETTPGPLVMVLSFVGFIGGWQHPGLLPPLVAATLGSVLTLWTTFVPSFLWIFLGAPVMERLRQVAWLRVVLAAVTAAVVGVILNLAAWLAAAVIFWVAVEPVLRRPLIPARLAILFKSRPVFRYNAEVMIRKLEIIFGQNPIPLKLRLPGQILIFLKHLRSITAGTIVDPTAIILAPIIALRSTTASTPTVRLTIIKQVI